MANQGQQLKVTAICQGDCLLYNCAPLELGSQITASYMTIETSGPPLYYFRTYVSDELWKHRDPRLGQNEPSVDGRSRQIMHRRTRYVNKVGK